MDKKEETVPLFSLHVGFFMSGRLSSQPATHDFGILFLRVAFISFSFPFKAKTVWVSHLRCLWLWISRTNKLQSSKCSTQQLINLPNQHQKLCTFLWFSLPTKK